MGKKILLFGEKGQVAWELRRSLSPMGAIHVLGSRDCDFRDSSSICKVIRDVKPEIIVNASAYTNVEKAESEESTAAQVNGYALGVIGEEAARINALVVHYSTDYVFDGTKAEPYVEEDISSPLNAYGRSKLNGEENLKSSGAKFLNLRVSWIYGNRGNNFYLTMLRLAKERDELRVVNDQIGAPTSCRYIADVTAQIIRDSSLLDKCGTYHISTQGEASWHLFASEIISQAREIHPNLHFAVKEIKPISSAEFGSKVSRPANSRLNHEKVKKAFGIHAVEWQECLKRTLEDAIFLKF
ncbi:dTDP-4-dehydrorhamnose reductase [Bdellovibrio sp. HCB-110]|uniref:dTDP-4-dehydrorhamnose reductase n=1 Tax=Bdellovibrio sp. HCB-110 TaxID=3391182 RepID=UPI0039B53A39